MKVNKFKKVGKNRYKVFFDNTDLILFEDIILKYELLTKKDIDVHSLDKIIEENRWYEAYDLALSYIEIKMRNKEEIIKYLENKMYDRNVIDDVLNKLDKLGLLDDKKYISAYVNDKANLSNDGPFKIRQSLIDLGFNEEDINSYIFKVDREVWSNKLDKLINKKTNLMRTKSYFMFINKMKNDLYNLGYDKDMIEEKLSKIDYESDALEHDFEKALKKYKDDKNKLISYLLRKGYSYEEINSYCKKQ